jgi:hypothetical protein
MEIGAKKVLIYPDDVIPRMQDIFNRESLNGPMPDNELNAMLSIKGIAGFMDEYKQAGFVNSRMRRS